MKILTQDQWNLLVQGLRLGILNLTNVVPKDACEIDGIYVPAYLLSKYSIFYL